jgi:uncharacterized protein (DUF2147 family)
MKKLLLSFALLLAISISGIGQVSKIVGKWKTIDDKDGSAKSIVLVFKATNGKYYGKIEKLFKEPEKLCTECEGANKGKPVMGMMIINNMVESDGKLTGGTILDPKNGKVYKCKIEVLDNGAKLKIRGYKGISLVGRTEYWNRVK